jgi:uncharacterized protein YukE
MASPTTTQKKSGQKADVILDKISKLLETRELGDLQKTKQTVKGLVFKEKNKKILIVTKTTRSKAIHELTEEAASLAKECSAIRTMYEDFRKQSGNLSKGDYDNKQLGFYQEMKEKRDALASFFDTLRVKHSEATKFEERIRKHAKNLKGDPDAFKTKVGFPLDDAKKRGIALRAIAKQLIKAGVQIRRAEMALDLTRS